MFKAIRKVFQRIGLSDFEELKVLGRGGFGCVKLVRKLGGVDDGMLYAMKVVFEDLKRLVAPVVFGALLIVINSCVLNFVVQ
jgi:hypothetical protein